MVKSHLCQIFNHIEGPWIFGSIFLPKMSILLTLGLKISIKMLNILKGYKMGKAIVKLCVKMFNQIK